MNQKNFYPVSQFNFQWKKTYTQDHDFKTIEQFHSLSTYQVMDSQR